MNGVTGRVDIALERTAELFMRGMGDTGARIWDGGLKDIAREMIKHHVGPKVLTAEDIARELGLLPRKRRVHGVHVHA